MFCIMSNLAEAEVAVRSYLLMLEDPASLIDAAHIATLEAALGSATDPIDKLKALAELDRARVPDREAYEQAFIRHAKTWATENDIPVSSFQQLDVSDQMLQAAGLLAPRRAARGQRGDVRRGAGTAVSKETIKAHVNTLTAQFTLADVAERAGGSPMTLRKAIEELISAGTLEKLGTSTTHVGRGRAPIIYANRTAKKTKR